jgi:hypothetical protein
MISTDGKGGRAYLTWGSPMSHYGCPVLRIDAEDVDGDFGPADLIDASSIGRGVFPAANIVAGWVAKVGRTPEEVEAARKFLAQWPEGPQVSQAVARLPACALAAHRELFAAWVSVPPGRMRLCVFGGHRHRARSEAEGECLDYALCTMTDGAAYELEQEPPLMAAQVKFYWDLIVAARSSPSREPVKPIEPGRNPRLN